MVLLIRVKVRKWSCSWSGWIRLFPDHFVVILIHFINFSWSHYCGSLCAWFDDVPSASLVELEDREEQIIEVVVVWLLIKT